MSIRCGKAHGINDVSEATFHQGIPPLPSGTPRGLPVSVQADTFLF